MEDRLLVSFVVRLGSVMNSLGSLKRIISSKSHRTVVAAGCIHLGISPAVVAQGP